jgi:uncharacterized glyoxalase superfamily protein PhnB
MKIDSLIPMIWVEDVKSTVDYYLKKLNFILLNNMQDWSWASIEKDGVEIMFSIFNEHINERKSHFTGSFYLKTNDIDKWWNLLKDEAEIFYPIENFEYGMREFAIKDCNGYILQFGQNLQQ